MSSGWFKVGSVRQNLDPKRSIRERNDGHPPSKKFPGLPQAFCTLNFKFFHFAQPYLPPFLLLAAFAAPFLLPSPSVQASLPRLFRAVGPSVERFIEAVARVDHTTGAIPSYIELSRGHDSILSTVEQFFQLQQGQELIAAARMDNAAEFLEFLERNPNFLRRLGQGEGTPASLYDQLVQEMAFFSAQILEIRQNEFLQAYLSHLRRAERTAAEDSLGRSPSWMPRRARSRLARLLGIDESQLPANAFTGTQEDWALLDQLRQDPGRLEDILQFRRHLLDGARDAARQRGWAARLRTGSLDTAEVNLLEYNLPQRFQVQTVREGDHMAVEIAIPSARLTEGEFAPFEATILGPANPADPSDPRFRIGLRQEFPDGTRDTVFRDFVGRVINAQHPDGTEVELRATRGTGRPQRFVLRLGRTEDEGRIVRLGMTRTTADFSSANFMRPGRYLIPTTRPALESGNANPFLRLLNRARNVRNRRAVDTSVEAMEREMVIWRRTGVRPVRNVDSATRQAWNSNRRRGRSFFQRMNSCLANQPDSAQASFALEATIVDTASGLGRFVSGYAMNAAIRRMNRSETDAASDTPTDGTYITGFGIMNDINWTELGTDVTIDFFKNMFKNTWYDARTNFASVWFRTTVFKQGMVAFDGVLYYIDVPSQVSQLVGMGPIEDTAGDQTGLSRHERAMRRSEATTMWNLGWSWKGAAVYKLVAGLRCLANRNGPRVPELTAQTAMGRLFEGVAQRIHRFPRWLRTFGGVHALNFGHKFIFSQMYLTGRDQWMYNPGIPYHLDGGRPAQDYPH